MFKIGNTWIGGVVSGIINNGISLWSFGTNVNGQLGDSSLVVRSSPVQVGTLTNWATIGAGGSAFSHGIRTDGSLWAWGGNGNYGALGLNIANNSIRSSPVQIGTFTNWTTISSTINNGSAVNSNGNAFVWGQGTSGQIGNNLAANVSSPVQIGTLTNWATTGVSSGAGGAFITALDTSNQLWSWGANATGQLGQNVSTVAISSPVQVGTLTNWTSQFSPGGTTILAIKSDNSLWSWGNNSGNSSGALGINTSVTSASSPVQVGTLTNWSVVASGRYGSSALKSDGTLWGWGANAAQFGMVGDGTLTVRSSPVQIGTLTNWVKLNKGTLHSLAIKSDGSLWGWGSGIGSNLANLILPTPSSPVQVGTLTNWTSVGASQSSAGAVDSSGKLWVWGLNNNGQLGLNIPDTSVSSPVQVGTLTNWKIVTLTSTQSHAIKTDNTLWGWGFNPTGDSTGNNRSSPVQIGTATNWSFLADGLSNGAAINSTGQLWMWGINNVGQLGQNNATLSNSPVQVGTLTNWTNVSFATSGVTAVKTDGSLWSWGSNGNGINGTNDAPSVVSRSSPIQVGTLTNWAKIFGGDGNVTADLLATKTDGSLWGWGLNTNGQLGDNSIVTRSSPVQIGTLTNWASASFNVTGAHAIKTDNSLWGWGVGTNGQIGAGTNTNTSSPIQIGTLTNWLTVAGGSSFTVAIKTDNTFWGWGYRGLGNLGDGLTSFLISPVQIGTATNWTLAKGGGTHSETLRN